MASTKGLVLVVEDEPSQMELLSFNLKAEGYDVLKATSGEEGILLFQENEPDLALLDWMLPNMFFPVINYWNGCGPKTWMLKPARWMCMWGVCVKRLKQPQIKI